MEHNMISGKSSSTYTPVEQALLLAQEELHKSMHDHHDSANASSKDDCTDKDNSTSSQAKKDGLIDTQFGDNNYQSDIQTSEYYYQQHLQLQQQYYLCQNRTKNELPYKDWAELFPGLDLIQGKHYSPDQSNGRIEQDLRTPLDENLAEPTRDGDMDTSSKEDTTSEENCSIDIDAAFGTRDLDKIIEYRDRLKQLIMDKLLAEIKK